MMMTISACLWLGAFPLLQFGTYAHITADKWTIMLILTGLTVLCAATDLIVELVRGSRAAWPTTRPATIPWAARARPCSVAWPLP